MPHILELIFQGLLQWIHGLILEIVEFLANSLLDVFGMDLAFFESALPVTHDIFNIVIASGWAMLLGNLVFQAAKSMMSGIGFEADDPRETFTRTFVFAFFLLASRQICEIGLGLSASLIDLLQVPDAVNIAIIDENAFGIGASWLLVIIFSFIIMWQLVKLFLEVGERYFLVGLLTILAPWAFAMGGSKSTADIFKGWVRMFASMCLMMVLNVVILKIMLSAISSLPSGADCVPWMILIVAIARVGRKIDSVVVKIGLNPAVTGDGLGKGLPGMLSYMVVRSAASKVLNTASTANNGGATNRSTTRNTANASTASSSKRASTANSTSRGNSNSQSSANVSSRNTQGGTSVHSPNATTTASKYDTSVSTAANGQSSVSSRNIDTKNSVHSVGFSSPASPLQAKPNEVGSLGKRSGNGAERMPDRAQAGTAEQSLSRRGTAGTPPSGGITSRGAAPNPVSASAGTPPKSASNTLAPARFSSVPPNAKPSRTRPSTSPTSGTVGTPPAGGIAGTSATSVTSRVQQGGASVKSSAQNANTSVSRNSVRSEANSTSERAPNANANPTQPAAAPHGTAGTQPVNPARPTSAAATRFGIAGTPAPNVSSQSAPSAKTSIGNAGTAQNAPRPSSPTQRPSSPASPIQPKPNIVGSVGKRSDNGAERMPDRARAGAAEQSLSRKGIAGTAPNITSNAVKPANPYKPRQPNLGKGGSAKNTAKNVTEKRKNSKFRSGGKADGEQ